MNNVKVFISQALHSRTMRFNGIMGALMTLEGSLSLIQPFIPGNVFAYASVILAVGNAYYRTQTTEPLSSK